MSTRVVQRFINQTKKQRKKERKATPDTEHLMIHTNKIQKKNKNKKPSRVTDLIAFFLCI